MGCLYCICGYFSAHISILGHVRLISKTVCSRERESAPLGCFHFETPIPGYQNKNETNTYIHCENTIPLQCLRSSSQCDPLFFGVFVITERLLICGKLIQRLTSREIRRELFIPQVLLKHTSHRNTEMKVMN